jgi:hypothetical protein
MDSKKIIFVREISEPATQWLTGNHDLLTERKITSFRYALLPMVVLMLTAFLTSCQQDSVQPNQEPESEIELLEKEFGVTFFTQDVTLVDAGGSNEMVLRVAALEKGLVEEFLKSREMSIIPVFEKGGKVTQINDSYSDESDNDELDLSRVIIVDVVSQTLDKGVIGLGVHNKINPNYSLAPNARSKYLNPDVWHDSMTWPEEFYLQAYNQVYWKLQRKTRWWSGWSTVIGPFTWCCYQYERYYIVRIDSNTR